MGKCFWHSGEQGGCESVESCLFKTTPNLMQANAVIVYLQRKWAQREEMRGREGYGNVNGNSDAGLIIAYD